MTRLYLPLISSLVCLVQVYIGVIASQGIFFLQRFLFPAIFDVFFSFKFSFLFTLICFLNKTFQSVSKKASLLQSCRSALGGRYLSLFFSWQAQSALDGALKIACYTCNIYIMSDFVFGLRVNSLHILCVFKFLHLCPSMCRIRVALMFQSFSKFIDTVFVTF